MVRIMGVSIVTEDVEGYVDILHNMPASNKYVKVSKCFIIHSLDTSHKYSDIQGMHDVKNIQCNLPKCVYIL